jgi:hypothetical protein
LHKRQVVLWDHGVGSSLLCFELSVSALQGNPLLEALECAVNMHVPRTWTIGKQEPGIICLQHFPTSWKMKVI